MGHRAPLVSTTSQSHPEMRWRCQVLCQVFVPTGSVWFMLILTRKNSSLALPQAVLVKTEPEGLWIAPCKINSQPLNGLMKIRAPRTLLEFPWDWTLATPETLIFFFPLQSKINGSLQGEGMAPIMKQKTESLFLEFVEISIIWEWSVFLQSDGSGVN